jgi:cell division protein FtsQ
VPNARPAPPAGGAGERAVRRARRRFARRQWARRWLAWRRLLAALVALGAVVGLVWLVFFSSVLAVTAVEVAGAEVLEESDVRQAAGVPLGRPLATVPLEAVAARVEGLAPVAAVEVTRSWPDRVRIAVVEREAVAVVERDDSFVGVDAEGVLFRSYPSLPAGLPVVRISAATRTEALAEAARVVDALPADLATRVDHLAVRSVDDITLQLRNRRTVVWGSADASADKARVLTLLLDRKARVYDVSVPGQPTLTP